MSDRGEGLRVVRIDDQPGDFVALVGNDGFLQELRKRHVGEHMAGGHALLRRRGADAREFVARSHRAGGRPHMLQDPEPEDMDPECGSITHGSSYWTGTCRWDIDRHWDIGTVRAPLL